MWKHETRPKARDDARRRRLAAMAFPSASFQNLTLTPLMASSASPLARAALSCSKREGAVGIFAREAAERKGRKKKEEEIRAARNKGRPELCEASFHFFGVVKGESSTEEAKKKTLFRFERPLPRRTYAAPALLTTCSYSHARVRVPSLPLSLFSARQSRASAEDDKGIRPLSFDKRTHFSMAERPSAAAAAAPPPPPLVLPRRVDPLRDGSIFDRGGGGATT